eukprot:Skav200312  [mRNA]  locus=scaffold414:31348:34069:+ [translate_table: standard]
MGVKSTFCCGHVTLRLLESEDPRSYEKMILQSAEAAQAEQRIAPRLTTKEDQVITTATSDEDKHQDKEMKKKKKKKEKRTPQKRKEGEKEDRRKRKLGARGQAAFDKCTKPWSSGPCRGTAQASAFNQALLNTLAYTKGLKDGMCAAKDVLGIAVKPFSANLKAKTKSAFYVAQKADRQDSLWHYSVGHCYAIAITAQIRTFFMAFSADRQDGYLLDHYSVGHYYAMLVLLVTLRSQLMVYVVKQRLNHLKEGTKQTFNSTM